MLENMPPTTAGQTPYKCPKVLPNVASLGAHGTMRMLSRMRKHVGKHAASNRWQDTLQVSKGLAN